MPTPGTPSVDQRLAPAAAEVEGPAHRTAQACHQRPGQLVPLGVHRLVGGVVGVPGHDRKCRRQRQRPHHTPAP